MAVTLPNPPIVSVVIPTLNREEPLRSTLAYFLDSETYRPLELIVVDQSDRHDPETEDLLRRASSRMVHVRVPYKNLSKARNHGVRLSRGEIVLFVDDDVEPWAGFVAAHAGPYRDPCVIGVTGPILSPGQRLRSATEIDDRLHQALVARTEMRFDVDFPFSACWAMGCNMSFRRELIERLGGFDENFCDGGVATGDDAEFSHRAKKHGTIQYAPEARLVHWAVGSGGCRHLSRPEVRIPAVVQNMVYFWHRVEVSRWVRTLMLARLFRRTVCTRKTLRDGMVLRSTAYFTRGLLQGHCRAQRLLRPRRPAQGTRQFDSGH